MLYSGRTSVNQIMQEDSLFKTWNKQAAWWCIPTTISLSCVLSIYCRPKQASKKWLPKCTSWWLQFQRQRFPNVSDSNQATLNYIN